jgi:flagellar biosynthesis/type III secretory pathway chaperone
MMPAELRSELESLLVRMTRSASELAIALVQERNALRALALDVPVLDATSQAKHQALAALEECEAVRRQLCQRAGVGAEHQAMRSLLARLDGGSALAQRWIELTEALVNCRRDNRATGVLLASSKRRITETLALLRGDSGNRDLYGPDGRAHLAASGGPLASA